MVLKEVNIDDIFIEEKAFEKKQLSDSIKRFGLICPIILCYENGKYFVLDGRKRLRTYESLGYKVIPSVVIEGSYDINKAILGFSSSIANSKKAEIIWDCYNRRKCQGKRSDLYDGVKRNTLQKVSSQFGMSQSTFNKWLRIHYLIDYFKDWFDSGRLSLASAVELSYLSVRRQFLIYSVVNKYGGCIGKDKAIKLRSIPEIIGNGEAVEKSVYNIMYLDN